MAPGAIRRPGIFTTGRSSRSRRCRASLASNDSTTRNSAWTTGTITSWAIRSNGCTVKAALPRFQQLTISGPW